MDDICTPSKNIFLYLYKLIINRQKSVLHFHLKCDFLLTNGTEYKITCSVCVCVCAHGLWGRIFQRRLEIEVVSNGTSIGNGIWRIDWSRDWWRHVTYKLRSNRDPQYVWGPLSRKLIEILTRVRTLAYGEWSRNRRRHENQTGQVGGHDGYILKSVRISIWQTPCFLSIILLL